MKPMKVERSRVDVDAVTKSIVDDMVERGLFNDSQAVIAAAVVALQQQVADQSYTDEYDSADGQDEIDRLQLTTP